MTARYLVADVFDGLATLEDGTVDLVITSPPFLALRSYLPSDHPDKSKEIGSEATPAEFLDVLLRVTAELRRVLAPHGSIAVELGDTYAGSTMTGGDDRGNERYPTTRSGMTVSNHRSRHPVPRQSGGEGWPLAKSKTLIPEMYRIALAYGINPLTGQESPAGRWRIRNVVTWARPNPPVGALGDKWRNATSDVVVACVSDKRYWDDIATRRPSESIGGGTGFGAWDSTNDKSGVRRKVENTGSHAAGAPLLDYWEIPPGGYPGSHYAVFPPALVEPLVKAMTPPKVCRQCGEPSRRIVEYSRPVDRDDRQRIKHANGERPAEGRQDRAPEVGWEIDRTTTGWTDCGHDDYRPALILDPFAGSGTTLSVATGHGHDAIGFDIDERNAVLAEERIGPFLFERPIPDTQEDRG